MLDCQSAEFAEQILADYLRDPKSVSESWQRYLAELGVQPNGNAYRTGPGFKPSSIFNPMSARVPKRPWREARQQFSAARLQDRLAQLVRAYRVRGHLAAKLDPLGLPRDVPAELDPAWYGIRDEDLERRCSSIGIGGPNAQSLDRLIGRLRNTYCRSIAVQFMHIDELEVRDWLAERMEASENHLSLSRAQQLSVLTRLTDAVIFEEFVRKKYVGAKTFSLEGAETLIPLLDLAIEKAGSQGTAEIVIGMAHRGRLNVLANIVGKRPEEIFWEFEDPDAEMHRGRGDVKYHLGHSGDRVTADGHKVHLSLCFNPSHLEFVDPVALGRTRAKQDRVGDHERRRGMTLLIHGDAAFAGEGIVQESLNFSQLAGYQTGGTLHVIINNQLGFTTSPEEGRSTTYASDVARMLQVPIFHVNGEHPEAVAQTVDLAMEFRARFRRDVVIDMYCYRRWGHNEADEPSFTQPMMYHAIAHRETIRDRYLEHLLALEGVTRQEAEAIAERRGAHLQAQFQRVKDKTFKPTAQTLTGVWRGMCGGIEPRDDEPDTGLDRARLAELLVKLTEVPSDFHLHRKLQGSVASRREMAEGAKPLDWSAAEALALASLAVEGHPIRLSGQDSARGTFSQRHAALHDIVDGHAYCPLQHLSPDQARVDILNSPLSEAGVLGFEYGYSLDCPEGLILWEAQYGDFWNAAQVVVDQFIASAEDKWQRMSGLVLLLPHGFEGQGPEHSSARLERFLSLAAEDNLQVVYPTTPAQYFHCLRRQVKRRWRKPLIVLTPKSLLRHRQVVSRWDELAVGHFQRVLPDDDADRSTPVSRVLICSGKLYYELVDARRERERPDVAILRIEQLYPLQETIMHDLLAPYSHQVPVYWVQEEPHNMGAWPYWRLRICDRTGTGHVLKGITRPASASPATGSKAVHQREQRELIERAFND
jgi:2-oxoglutarate dehydrogenase E1 component